METNDITVENFKKVYEYLNTEYKLKIENLEDILSKKIKYLDFVDAYNDEKRKDELSKEIESLEEDKKYYMGKLSELESLENEKAEEIVISLKNNFSEDAQKMPGNLKNYDKIRSYEYGVELSKLSKQISSQEAEYIKQSLNENNISLNDEGVFELESLSGKDLHRAERYNRLVNSDIEHIDLDLNYYENQIENYTKLSELEEQSEKLNGVDVEQRQIVEQQIEDVKQKIEEVDQKYKKRIAEGKEEESNVVINRYSDVINNLKLSLENAKKVNANEDFEYYNSQIDSLTELSKIEDEIDKLKEKNEVENEQKLQELNNTREELIERVKQTQRKYNERSIATEETENNKQEVIEEKIESKNKDKVGNEHKHYNYHISSELLTKKYDEVMQQLNSNRDDIESNIKEIEEEFSSSDIDINNEDEYEDNEKLVELKEKYDELNEQLENADTKIDEIQNSDINIKINEIKDLENQIEELDSDIESIEKDIQKYTEILEDGELEDSGKKEDAKSEIEKLEKERINKVSEKLSADNKKDEIYSQVNKRLNQKSTQRHKTNKNKNNSIPQNQGYWIVPQNSNVQQAEIPATSNDTQESLNDNSNIENNSLVAMSSNIIEDYIKSDDDSKNELYLRKNFYKLVGELKNARGFGKISKSQKNMLKKAVENHGFEISKNLGELDSKTFSKIIFDIYGDDRRFLNRYITKDDNTGEEELNLGVFYDIYNYKEGKIRGINSFDTLNYKSNKFIQNLFNKYYEKVQKGEIEKGSPLDVQFNKMIADPIKYGIISEYNKDIQKTFLGKIKMLFSKASKEKYEKIDIISSNIKYNDDILAAKNGKSDKLDLKGAVIENPAPIADNRQQSAPTRSIDTKEI